MTTDSVTRDTATSATPVVDSQLGAEAPAAWVRMLPWLILGITLLLVVPLRIKFLDLPMDRDEGEFGYGGQLILEGDLPYRSLYAMKMPGIYACYALIEAAFGQTRTGVHLGLLVVHLLTLLGVFVLAGRLYDSLTGAMAAAAYSLLSLSPSIDPFASQSEHLVVLPVVWGLVALSIALAHGNLAWHLLAGVLIGLAPTIKQHGVVFAGAGAAWILLDQLVRRRLSWGRWSAGAALFGLGLAAPMAGVFAAMQALGVFTQFHFWTQQYASEYMSIVKPEKRWPNFVVNFAYQFNRFWSNTSLWIAAIVGLTALAWNRGARRHADLLLPWTIVSLVGLSLGFYFRTHYFVLMSPVLAVLIAVAVRALGERMFVDRAPYESVRIVVAIVATMGLMGVFVTLSGSWLAQFYNEHRLVFWFLFFPLVGLTALVLHALSRQLPAERRGSPGQIAALFAVLCAWPVVELGKYYLPLTPAQLSRKTYFRNPFVESIEIARKLAEISSPEDRIGLLCSEPQILFYAQRRSASGHIYMYPLMETHPYALTMQEQLIRDFEAVPPKYVVYSNQNVTWTNIRGKSHTRIYEWWDDYRKHYEPIGTVDMTYEKENVRWRTKAGVLTVNPNTEGLVIYRRREDGMAPPLPEPTGPEKPGT